MCGRIANLATPEELATTFEWVKRADILSILEPRYNVGPQSILPAIRGSGEEDEWVLLRWGLIPSWAKDANIGYRTINARAETVSEKPAFKSAFRRRRCLLPISGFYEWKANGSKKQPYYIHMRDQDLFTLAGLWESWKDPSGNQIETCTVVTTESNSLISPLHDRMPVIVSTDERDLWLHEDDIDVVRHVLRPFDPDKMELYPVSTYVNSVKNTGPECITPVNTLF